MNKDDQNKQNNELLEVRELTEEEQELLAETLAETPKYRELRERMAAYREKMGQTEEPLVIDARMLKILKKIDESFARLEQRIKDLEAVVVSNL